MAILWFFFCCYNDYFHHPFFFGRHIDPFLSNRFSVKAEIKTRDNLTLFIPRVVRGFEIQTPYGNNLRKYGVLPTKPFS